MTLKEGTKIRLRNGWEAIINDNREGNVRRCEFLNGFFVSFGAINTHDIEAIEKDGVWEDYGN